MLLLLYPRNHCQIQIYEPFPPSTFPFMFWPLTYFDLIFVYSIRKEPNFCVLHVKSFLSTIWEYVPFPIELSKPSWKIYLTIYINVLTVITKLLIFMSFLIPFLGCFDYCIFVVRLEIIMSSTTFLFQDFYGS